MKPKMSLDDFLSFKRDCDELEGYNDIHPVLVRQLLSAKNRSDIEDFYNDAQVFFDMRTRWKFHPTYYPYMKTKLGKVAVLQHAYSEKLEQLELGKRLKIETFRKKYPTLSMLLQEESMGADLPKDGGKGGQIMPYERTAPECDTKDSVLAQSVSRPSGGSSNDSCNTIDSKVRMVKSLMPSSRDNHTFTLYEQARWYKQRGLVGEEKNALIQTLAAAMKLSFIYESMSGSGKSYTLNMLFDLIPKDMVYMMELSSERAQLRSADEINPKKIINIPELQKALDTNNKFVIELVKGVTEHKDVSYRVTLPNGDIKVFEINGDKAILSTLAIENVFKYDAEMARRFFVLNTDVSTKQTDNVLEYQADSDHPNGRKSFDRLLDLKMPEHMRNLLNMDSIEFENPFANYVQKLIPRTVRARSYSKYLSNLIKGSAKFHYNQRERLDDILVVNLQDVVNIHTLYWKQFKKTLYLVPLYGEAVLDIFERSENPGQSADATTIYRTLRSTDPSINYDIVKSTLSTLRNAGFIEADDYNSRNPVYSPINGKVKFDDVLDTAKLFESGLQYMESHYKPPVVERWKERNIKEGRLVLTHPITGEDMSIGG